MWVQLSPGAPIFKFIHIFIHVIKLANILKEITADQKAVSWLNPDGNFSPVKVSYGQEAYRLSGDVERASNVLWANGWQKVYYYKHEVLNCSNELMRPNSIQIKKLIELAKELNFIELVYDNGKARETLWPV